MPYKHLFFYFIFFPVKSYSQWQHVLTVNIVIYFFYVSILNTALIYYTRMLLGFFSIYSKQMLICQTYSNNCIKKQMKKIQSCGTFIPSFRSALTLILSLDYILLCLILCQDVNKSTFNPAAAVIEGIEL